MLCQLGDALTDHAGPVNMEIHLATCLFALQQAAFFFVTRLITTDNGEDERPAVFCLGQPQLYGLDAVHDSTPDLNRRLCLVEEHRCGTWTRSHMTWKAS